MSDVLDALLRAGVVILLLVLSFALLALIGGVAYEVRRRNREGWPK